VADEYVWTVIVAGDGSPERFVNLVSEEEAIAYRDADAPGYTVARCRRLRPSEVINTGNALDSLVEDAQDDLSSDPPRDGVGVWAVWNDPLVSAREGAAEAFKRWCDEWLVVDIYEEPKVNDGACAPEGRE
jgi:hypothetical protein